MAFKNVGLQNADFQNTDFNSGLDNSNFQQTLRINLDLKNTLDSRLEHWLLRTRRNWHSKDSGAKNTALESAD